MRSALGYAAFGYAAQGVAACSLALVLTAAAFAEMTSGPQVGDTIGAFTGEKVGGNPEDGITDGQKLCYPCKMGMRPVVMVFARSADEKLAKLLKKLEEELQEHEADKLTGFVNMIGPDADSLKKAAADFIAKHGITRIAFLVPNDTKDGPPDLMIAPDADVTVVCYKAREVKANHAFAKGDLSDEKIDAIVEAACSLVN